MAAVRVETSELVNSDEVAQMLGLTRRQAVSTYRSRYGDFPAPVVDKGRCLLWRRSDIKAWARSTGRA